MDINGKNISNEIKQDLKKIIENEDLKLKLVVIIVGENPASEIYVKNKVKACENVGIISEVIKLDENISQDELIEIIKNLNANQKVNGILVQLPLPRHIDEKEVILSIDPNKDVDGFHPINMGNLVLGIEAMEPCTPKGIMYLLKKVHDKFEGLNAVVIGRSNIVGKPIANLLINAGATVTVVNSKTRNLREISKEADILIVAIGKPKYITKEYIKEGATVIDVGINRLEGKKICGDVDYEDVKNYAKYITPVPGELVL